VNTAVILELLIQLTMQAQKLAVLIKTARDQGRDVTDAELASLASDDDVAKAALDAAIAKAKGTGA
jgi:S-adenosylhomocysteine hydrolase